MKHAGLFIGLSASAVALTAAPAQAATGLVDGVIRAGGASCIWSNGVTTDVPPNLLQIIGSSIQPNCSGGSISVTIANNPTVVFNDANGTGSASEVAVVAHAPLGITCNYSVYNPTLQRQGTTRSYTGGPFTAYRTGGSFRCPANYTVDTVAVAFH